MVGSVTKWEKVGGTPSVPIWITDLSDLQITDIQMFIGEYQHSLDPKGRVSVPAKFRARLADGVVLTRGLDGCLWLLPKADWAELSEKVSALPMTQKNARSFSRFILSGAMD